MQRIEDYALIGDCETAALVGRGGSIDWLCWPRFDSGACFAALLGNPDHGRWLMAPSCTVARAERRYRDRTLILETDFETPSGAMTLINFMPIRRTASDIVRIVVGRSGLVPMRTELALRFDYGRLVPWITQSGTDSLRATVGPHSAILRTKVPLSHKEGNAVSEFTVGTGERIAFVLTYRESHLPPADTVDAEEAQREAEKQWHDWSRRCS